MIIKAVKFRKDGFYSQPFAFGGEEGMDKFNPSSEFFVLTGVEEKHRREYDENE